MRRPSRLSPEGMVLLGIVLFVLLAILYPVVGVLVAKKDAPPPVSSAQPGSPNFEVIGDSEYDDAMITVWLDGTMTDMPLEEYLVGVVAGEMPASFEMEALKAQAVAARTYTLYKKEHGGCSDHPGADICTFSGHCQAYVTDAEMSKNWGDNKTANLAKITDAVNATRGQKILYDGEAIQVFYHASAGGRTENSENVYSQALPYLRSVDSEGEESSRNYYGEVSVTIDEFKRKLEKFSSGIRFDNKRLIGDIVRFDSGRVESIEIGSQTFTGREVRQIFGLNSANFTIEQSENGIVFHTVGFGHGVGMSQTGANAMAKKGANHIEILTHYFLGVTVE